MLVNEHRNVGINFILFNWTSEKTNFVRSIDRGLGRHFGKTTRKDICMDIREYFGLGLLYSKISSYRK
jgi:hypothetical protein